MSPGTSEAWTSADVPKALVRRAHADTCLAVLLGAQHVCPVSHRCGRVHAQQHGWPQAERLGTTTLLADTQRLLTRLHERDGSAADDGDFLFAEHPGSEPPERGSMGAAAAGAAAAAERRGSSALASSSGRLEEVDEEAFEFQVSLAWNCALAGAVPGAPHVGVLSSRACTHCVPSLAEQVCYAQLRDMAGSVFRDAAVPSARRMHAVQLPGSDWEWATDWEVRPLLALFAGEKRVSRQPHPLLSLGWAGANDRV